MNLFFLPCPCTGILPLLCSYFDYFRTTFLFFSKTLHTEHRDITSTCRSVLGEKYIKTTTYTQIYKFKQSQHHDKSPHTSINFLSRTQPRPTSNIRSHTHLRMLHIIQFRTCYVNKCMQTMAHCHLTCSNLHRSG